MYLQQYFKPFLSAVQKSCLFPWKPKGIFTSKTPPRQQIISMMLVQLGVAFLLCISSVLGTDFYITQPWAETKWKAGETVTISWKLYTDVGPEAIGINLDLMDGEDLSANFLLNIASNLKADTSSFQWTIPKTVNSGDGLFVRITGLGSIPNYRFSHRFSISGGEGGAATVTVIAPIGQTVDVNALVNQLPPGSKNTVIPPVVSLIDPDRVEVVTETVSVMPTGSNRDRLTQSDASALKIPTAFFVALAAFAMIL